MSSTAYSRPDQLDAVRELLADHPEATIVGGGQTLLPLVREGVVDLEHVVDISSVPELTGIELTPETTRLGSAVTYRDLLEHEASSRHPMVEETVDDIADRQVRSMGTIGGALASGQTALDLVPALYCLDATVVIGSASGRRRVDVTDLYPNATLESERRGARTNFLGLAPVALAGDELIEAVELPHHPDGTRRGSEYRKQTNVAGGWTVAGVGTSVVLTPDCDRIDSVRVGLTAVGRTGATASTVEDALDGELATTDTIDAAAERLDIDPQTTLTSSGYTLTVARTLIRRCLTASIQRAGGDLS